MQTTWRKGHGFTIIELLVVILIIGLLTSLAATSYLAAQKRARDSARKTSVNTIAGALETYYNVNHTFPGDSFGTSKSTDPNCEIVTHLTSPSQNSPFYFFRPGVTCTSASWIPSLDSYLNPIPMDPNFQDVAGGNTGNVFDYMDSSDRTFQPNNQTRTFIYRNLTGSNSSIFGYAVYARLENTSDTDFTAQFSEVGPYNTVCTPNIDTSIPSLPDKLRCVPNQVQGSSNPMVVYMVRK